jgi:hypothetical protein
MKRFGLTTVLLCAFLSFANAKADVKDLFVNMPDSMVSYLDKNKRQEMIDYAEINKGAGVVNLLEGSSVIDSLSNDYLSVSLTSSSDLQMMVLSLKTDTVVCVVKTFKVDDGLNADTSAFSNIIKESRVEFYSLDWAPLEIKLDLPDAFLQKIDEMAPAFVEARLNPDKKTLLFSINCPLLTKEEKERLNRENQLTALKYELNLLTSIKNPIKRP